MVKQVPFKGRKAVGFDGMSLAGSPVWPVRFVPGGDMQELHISSNDG
ncbi:hypothetical protein HNQ56_002137 [Anaerotaenia torta]